VLPREVRPSTTPTSSSSRHPGIKCGDDGQMVTALRKGLQRTTATQQQHNSNTILVGAVPQQK
jgi:hypothetical protein